MKKLINVPDELLTEVLRIKDKVLFISSETATIITLISLGIKFLDQAIAGKNQAAMDSPIQQSNQPYFLVPNPSFYAQTGQKNIEEYTKKGNKPDV